MIEGKITGTLPELNLDFRDRLREVANIMERAVQLNFTMGGRVPSPQYFPNVDGAIPWEPLQPPRGGTPLVATGRFYHSVRSESDTTSASVEAGSNFSDPRIAWVHQMGTESAGRNHNVRIPARPYMTLTDFDIDKIKDVLMEDIIIRTNF